MAEVQAAAAGRFEDGSRHFSAAFAEWRGPVLEDIRAFEFSEIFAVALTEDKIAAHTARAQAEIACGRAEAVVGELETLVADHPYREPAWAQLMTAYYLAGRQSDALEAYSRLRATLADELGIDPNPTLRDLQERILPGGSLWMLSSQLGRPRTRRSSAWSTAARLVARLHGCVRPQVSAIR